MSITQQAITDYLTELGAKGATSKDLAKKFNTTPKLINRKFSAEHGDNYESTWKGIYSMPNLEHRHFRHYAVPDVFTEPKVDSATDDLVAEIARLNLLVATLTSAEFLAVTAKQTSEIETQTDTEPSPVATSEIETQTDTEPAPVATKHLKMHIKPRTNQRE